MVVEESSSITINYDKLTITSATPDHSGEYTCQAVNPWGKQSQGTSLWIRRRTKILTVPVYLPFSQGKLVQIDCKVDVDPNLDSSLRIDWFRGDQLLVPNKISNDIPVERPDEETDAEYNEVEEENRYTVYSNHTLEINDLRHDDIGMYRCAATTSLEPVMHSQTSQIFIKSEFPYWIIILILLILLVLIVVFYCVWRIRRRSKGKGYYGVKDIEQSGSMHNKSDIYYTTEDGDSIMLEQDNVPFTEVQGPTKPPIFTPKTIRQLAAMDKTTGSCGSLLDDEFLKRGMDEDGSFRERYAD